MSLMRSWAGRCGPWRPAVVASPHGARASASWCMIRTSTARSVRATPGDTACVRCLGDGVGELGGGQFGLQPAASQVAQKVIGHRFDLVAVRGGGQYGGCLLAGQVDSPQLPFGKNRGIVHGQQRLPPRHGAAEDAGPPAELAPRPRGLSRGSVASRAAVIRHPGVCLLACFRDNWPGCRASRSPTDRETCAKAWIRCAVARAVCSA